VAISFTVETDGVLPDGRSLADAIAAVEAAAPADWYGVNCAHPTHLAPALDDGAWQSKLRFLRPNASTMSHAELDEMEVLDAGDLGLLTSSAAQVRDRVPSVSVLGGCCGTDSSHVAALQESEGMRDGVRAYALDPDRARALWAKSEELVGETFPA
jgi:S-methylmethionine-dependent homocysteine/selenocysteine methylase